MPEFDAVGVYGICIYYTGGSFKYRYVTKCPLITENEFKKIVDPIMNKCNDINFIVRKLQLLGFNKLMVIADLDYITGDLNV